MDKFEIEAMIKYYIDVLERSKNPKHIEYASIMLAFHLDKLKLDTDMVNAVNKYSTNTA